MSVVTCIQVADILDDAYDMIDTRGHAVGAAAAHPGIDEDLPLCAGIAILRAGEERKTGAAVKTYFAFARWVNDRIPHWNDHHGPVGVLAELERCADFYRAKGETRVTRSTGRR